MSFNTCVIKNLSASNQSVLGVILAQNETYTIPDSRRIQAKNDSTIIDRISSGVLQVGNGSSFLSTTASQINYLSAGISDVTISGVDVDITEPKLTNQFIIESSFSKIDLNPNSSSYNTIYSYSGSGKLYNFILDFNSDNVLTKLSIDGSIIFDIDCDNLDSIFSGNFEIQGNLPLKFNSSSNSLIFSPPYALEFSSSVVIEAKANSNSSGRDLDGYVVFITKES